LSNSNGSSRHLKNEEHKKILFPHLGEMETTTSAQINDITMYFTPWNERILTALVPTFIQQQAPRCSVMHLNTRKLAHSSKAELKVKIKYLQYVTKILSVRLKITF
jgi:hypothetical protein